MKKLRLLTLILVLSSSQMFSQNWETDFETAKTMASEQDKIIVLVFQGSDWCAPCIKLDREIWSTAEFKGLAKDKFVMLKADFPRRKNNKLSSEQKEHNNKLAETYNTNGYFPYVVVLDETGKQLGSLGYEKSTPNEYYNKLVAFEN